jgi:xyloglucan-specific exo-beta-1,4-glucanase
MSVSNQQVIIMKNTILLSLLIAFFTLFQSHSQTTESYNWNTVAIGGGGFVSGIFFSPLEQNVIYARTDVGGAYRWNEETTSWISMMDWTNSDERGLLGVESLAIDPNDPGKLYMMTGTIYWNMGDDGIGRSAFLRSLDYGQTWEQIPVWDNSTKYFNVNGNGMGRGNGERLAIDPSDSQTMFYGSRNKGLWKSTNNGTSWSKVSSFPVDTTWNGCGISFVAFDPGNSLRIYVGIYRKADNIFVSEDGGTTWSLIPGMPQPTYDGTTSMGLMPQRIAIKPDGSAFFLTLGNGAGPHTMQWDEGWGTINDWYNRGAVYKYEVSSGTWTDISPQNFINPDEPDNPYNDPSSYYGTYSGISIDPDNPDHIVAASCASYRGPQFWLIDGVWDDEWGDNIFVTEDGGNTWVPSFQYYWMDGGYYPPAEQMDENGIPWIVHEKIHWISSVAIDPFNPQRVFVNSGNGVWYTDDIFNYEWSYEDEWGNADTSYTQYTVWKFASHDIEEIVPEDVVSIPGGPLVSVMLDAGGFVHDDVTVSPTGGIHKVSVSGSLQRLGSKTGLAYAPQNGRLASCTEVRSVSDQYTTTPIGPVQWSDDNGISWTTESYTSNPPTSLMGGKVALSADGEVTLWMPSEGTVMYRHFNSQWSEVSGISFNGRPVSDQVNENLFYVFNPGNGYMYVSIDKGASFSQAGYAGTSNFRNAVAVPGNSGHVWVPLANSEGTGGLMHSSDGGTSFTAVEGVDYCEAVGFGKAATGADYPTVFIFAEIDGVLGVWRSIDQGISWVNINDDEHEYGGLANGEFVVGDMNVFGRVYMSTAGRGIAYGEPTGSTVPVTGINVMPASATIAIGSTQQLEAEVIPDNATDQSLTWSSSNEEAAIVSNNGIVTGIGAGTATITVTTSNPDVSAICTITVTDSIVTPTYTLTITIVGNGTVTPSGGTYDEGTTVSLAATADEGYQFEGWSGSFSGTNPSITVEMDSDKNITATFIKESGEICDDPQTITLPFTYDGAGEFCWVSSEPIANINSWNLELLEINGVDYTNSFSDSFPESIDGNYYIHYIGNYAWSHLEIAASKRATGNTFKEGAIEETVLYPNPFDQSIILKPADVNNLELITITDLKGNILETITPVCSRINIGYSLKPGTYLIILRYKENQKIYKVIKQ